MTDAIGKAVHMEIVVRIFGKAIAKMILLLGKFIGKMDASLKALDMVMQIILNITGKAIAEMIPLLDGCKFEGHGYGDANHYDYHYEGYS